VRADRALQGILSWSRACLPYSHLAVRQTWICSIICRWEDLTSVQDQSEQVAGLAHHPAPPTKPLVNVHQHTQRPSHQLSNPSNARLYPVRNMLLPLLSAVCLIAATCLLLSDTVRRWRWRPAARAAALYPACPPPPRRVRIPTP